VPSQAKLEEADDIQRRVAEGEAVTREELNTIRVAEGYASVEGPKGGSVQELVVDRPPTTEHVEKSGAADDVRVDRAELEAIRERLRNLPPN
jgi:hypothetical protein